MCVFNGLCFEWLDTSTNKYVYFLMWVHKTLTTRLETNYYQKFNMCNLNYFSRQISFYIMCNMFNFHTTNLTLFYTHSWQQRFIKMTDSLTFNTSQIKKSNSNIFWWTMKQLPLAEKVKIPFLGSVSNLKFLFCVFLNVNYISHWRCCCVLHVWLLHNNMSMAHAPCSTSWLIILMEFFA